MKVFVAAKIISLTVVIVGDVIIIEILRLFCSLETFIERRQKRKGDFNIYNSNIFNICVQVFFVLI